MNLLFLLLILQQAAGLVPPKFQWKTIDFAWKEQAREAAISDGDYIPQNNMPSGLARWKDKLFITIPRWKTGVPSNLNYININGTQGQPLNPYPTWEEGFISHQACDVPQNSSTSACAFRVQVDTCDRLWVVDNGVTDMAHDVKQISEPAILIYDLKTDTLLHKYEMDGDVLKDSSVLTDIAIDMAGKAKDCSNVYAYIADMGANAIIVYSLKDNEAWRVENDYFHFDPQAGSYKVGGIEFYWNDGVSSVTLSKQHNDGHRDLYFLPTSSTKQFKLSTKLLRTKDVSKDEIFNAVQIVGDRGPMSQASACDYDPQNNVLFYTQLNKNGVGCWNLDKPFNEANAPVIISDCKMLEFPVDIKVDQEGDLWILSNRQSRFLYGTMDFDQVNFRVLSAPVSEVIRGTACEKQSKRNSFSSFMKRPKPSSSKNSKK